MDDDETGLTILARIPAKTNAELEAQVDKGVRHIPFADLQARAAELPDLVDAAAAEILAAVAAAPAPEPRPSTREDLDTAAYLQLQNDAGRQLLEIVDRLIRVAPGGLSVQASAEARSAGALRVAALAAVAARLDLPDLTEMLGDEVRALRQRQDAVNVPGRTLN